ncbi:leucine-rich repeat-containing protein 59-like isoform X1 [Branchiostoma floridae x Branchiostoma japonicum]
MAAGKGETKWTLKELKDRLEGNELDLSLSNITKVPVQLLSSLPKATVLDLSCNLLVNLQDPFCTQLTHVVKLDLSKNQLEELPADFGRLTRLRHLDLFQNRLKTVPVSFWQLTSLQWLDLKDNPLDSALVPVVGDCLDERQCRNCAKGVVSYMRAVNSELERKRQEQLQQQRKLEEARRLQEEQEQELRRRKKKEEKERRKREYAERQASRKQQQEGGGQEEEADTEEKANGIASATPEKHRTTGSYCYKLPFIIIMLSVIAVAVATYFYCESEPTNQLCRDLQTRVHQVETVIRGWVAVAKQMAVGQKE